MTNCKTPCNYNEYKLAYNPPRSLTDLGDDTVFGLEAISENTEFQEEVLLYPPSKFENMWSNPDDDDPSFNALFDPASIAVLAYL